MPSGAQIISLKVGVA